jgi:hypothetical protein
MPKAAADVGASKTHDEIAAEEERRLAELGSPMAQRPLAIPRRDAGGMSGMAWPGLTRSNYNSWSLLMKVILQARGLWDVIKTGQGEYADDRSAVEAILRAVPHKMIPTLAVKNKAKEAWDAIKTIRVGAERVRESKVQLLRKEYDHMRFKQGETVDDFGMRLQELVHQLEVLGDPVDGKMVIPSSTSRWHDQSRACSI